MRGTPIIVVLLLFWLLHLCILRPLPLLLREIMQKPSLTGNTAPDNAFQIPLFVPLYRRCSVRVACPSHQNRHIDDQRDQIFKTGPECRQRRLRGPDVWRRVFRERGIESQRLVLVEGAIYVV